MRSLTTKLTVAFFVMGLIVAVFVALIVTYRTLQEFDQFVTRNDDAAMIESLTNYYASSKTWDGVARIIDGDPIFQAHSEIISLLNASGEVVFSYPEEATQEQWAVDMRANSTPLEVEGEIVAYLLIGRSSQGRSGGSRDSRSSRPRDSRSSGPRGGPSSGLREGRPPQEVDFLDNITFVSTISVLGASMMALILGTLLTRTLVRPIRTLTEATEAMSRGELGLQVDIQSGDEIGQLATSFNQMSAELARAQSYRQQMTADIAHDLRTPLSILRLYAEGLEDGHLSGDEKIYKIMHQEVLYLQDLVGNLHTLSLADAGQLSLNLRPIDPKALLERTGLAYVMQAEEQGVTLRIDAPYDLPSVLVDTTSLTQVLNNLVANALRFTEEGEIVLSASANEETVQLQVRDTGAGIPPDDLPHIFNRFYRADKSRQRTKDSAIRKSSSGLGLAIAKAIVKAHGGTIKANSVLAEGSTFSITLPVGTNKIKCQS